MSLFKKKHSIDNVLPKLHPCITGMDKLYTFSSDGARFFVLAKTEREAWAKVRRITNSKRTYCLTKDNARAACMSAATLKYELAL